jgi:NarL family two-component system sensor histidine kinase LiaS
MSKSTPRTKRFQQLRWRLTLTYTAVTVGALITVEFLLLVIIGVGVVLLTNSGYLPEQLIQAVSADYAPILKFYLGQTPPDQEGIGEWLMDVGAASNLALPLTFEATDEMFVVDDSGILLAVKPPDLLGEDVIGKPLNRSVIPGLEEPLQAALQGKKDPENLYTLNKNDRKVIMAFPIRGENQQEILGALVAIGELPTVWSQMGELLPIISLSLLFFTIVAGLVGTVYGFLAARGPVQRLDRLAEASLAWSNGDFTVRVEDSSGDELGQLAHRLNEMSLQLDGMMETRRELAIMEERNRLARDLHDSAKQQAFAAAAQISTARKLINTDPEAAEKHIQEAERLTLALRKELTSLIQQLRPAALEGKGLAAALYEYTQEWSRQSGIAANVRVQRQRALDLEIEQNVFRIVQEALSNIARHSNATQVDIEVIYSTNNITSSIHDNGSGFDPGSVNNGFGMQSMSERAERLGGTLSIESKPGAGTIISIKLPLNGSSVSDLEDMNA